ncbi:hypothetical protein P43SY_004728 [Pythium insidiosum]|uniref:Acyltransferase 3 domain-containing protein n=1 Tax=Pythium insidiosum TaxID=114742 RepID=A0AAD5LWF6_PYTIN|nr:hypothetical protein P43SY_004728 [Pythium insidiosum]
MLGNLQDDETPRGLSDESVVLLMKQTERSESSGVPDIALPVVAPADQAGAAGKSQIPGRRPKTQPPQSKIYFLNGLRGLAAYFVIIQHGHWGDRNYGAYGVDMFFVLSSFLLTMLFDKKVHQLLDRRAAKHSWVYAMLDYFSRRFLRVYPLFALVAIVLWMLPNKYLRQYWVDVKPGEYGLGQVLTFDLHHRYHVFWTLPVEIGYYFVIPVLVVSIALLRKWWWVPILPLTYWVIHEGNHQHRADHLPLRNHISTFVSGSIGAIVLTRAEKWIHEKEFQFRLPHQIALRAVEYINVALLMQIIFGGLFFEWLNWYPLPYPPGTPFLSGYLTIIIVCEILLPGPLSRFLEWNILRYFGKISYSMYLLHSFVVYNEWIKKQSHYNKIFATTALVCAISSASFQLIELPLQRLAGRISKNLKEPLRRHPTIPLPTTASRGQPQSVFQSLWIGATAGMGGIIAVYPVDVVKTRMQNSRVSSSATQVLHSIFRQEGVLSFYKGLGPQLIGTIPDKAISLATREYVKSRFEDPTTFTASFASAATSGVTQSVVMNPVEIVKVRMQIDSSLTAAGVVRELGVQGIYRGYSACFARDVFFAATYFTLYDLAKKKLEIEDGSALGWSLLAASSAGIPAAFFSTPLDVLKTRMQSRSATTRGFVETLRAVHSEGGAKALFAGWGPRVGRIAPQFGIVLVSYDWLSARFSAST